MDLDINNIINISVSQTPVGVSAYNTSNLAIITDDTAGAEFGTDGYKIYFSASQVAEDFGTDTDTYKMSAAIFQQPQNILTGGGYLVVIPTLASETLGEAIERTDGLVQYFGVISNLDVSDVDLAAAAAVVQSRDKILGVVSIDSADLDTSGSFDNVRLASQDQTRCLFHTDLDEGLLFLAGYFGRGLSVNFNGSATTQTMDLKPLVGVLPGDYSSADIIKAKEAGADIYVTYGGVPRTKTSGENKFFDRVYNRLWMVGALKVAGFNTLATASTKIAQTEDGVDALKAAYIRVLELGVTNGFIAPSAIQASTTFGDPEDFYANIEQRGYYVYSQPVSKQLASERADRKAPLIQIAVQEAGAIHTSSLIININR